MKLTISKNYKEKEHMSKKEVVFISDFFLDDILGGAELSDSALCSYLEQELKIEKIHSKDVTKDFLLKNKDKFFIISNFTMLSQKNKILFHWLWFQEMYFLLLPWHLLKATQHRRLPFQ